MMPSASGSIMAAVAVLLIHIDSAALAPNIISAAAPRCERAIDRIQNAILRSSCCALSAVASAKPPKNRKMMGSANDAMALAVVTPGMPSVSAPTGTSSAVTVTCTASVSHSTATNSSSTRPLRAASSKGRARYSNTQATSVTATMSSPRSVPRGLSGVSECRPGVAGVAGSVVMASRPPAAARVAAGAARAARCHRAAPLPR